MPRRKITIVFLLIGLMTIFFAQCNKSEDSQAVKLLKEKQVVNQKRAQIIDSLKQEQMKSLEEKGELIEKIKEYKEQNLTTEMSLKKNLQLKKAEYENEFLRIGQELEAINFKISELEKLKEEKSNQSAYTDTAKIWAKQHVRNEISEIDQVMDALEKERQLEKKKIPIIQKKMEISEKKLSALNEENNLYLEQKNDLIRNDGSDEALNSINEQIAGIDAEIIKEKQKYVQAESELNRSKSRIAEIDIQLQQMVKNIQQKQSKKEALNEFIAAEKVRLKEEKIQLMNKIALLEKENQALLDQEKDMKQKLATISEKIAIVKSEEEMTAPDDVRREAPQVEQSEKEEVSVEEDTESALDKLAQTEAKPETKQKTSEVAPTEEDSGLGWTFKIMLLILIGVAAIVTFYFVGKKAKKTKE